MAEARQSQASRLDERWEVWLDESIPALGDETPREAARTPRGRELLEALLHDYEWSSEKLPDSAFTLEVETLRRKLGL
jgi:hypothetical protein